MLFFLKLDSIVNGNARWLCRCDCGVEKVVSAYHVKSGNIKSCGCLKKHEDLAGQKFNYYTFIKESSKDKNGHILWICRCDCGNERILLADAVKRGATKSCGCLRYNYEDFTGKKVGRLVVKSLNSNIDGDYYWNCECKCGNKCIVVSSNLKNKHTKSCGCLRSVAGRKRRGKNHPLWRHDLTKEEREENKNRRYCPKNHKWRIKVFNRDNYTCQICSDTRKKNLVVHHIYAYNKYKKLRYTTSNGVVLCKSCHIKFHKIYGRGNNTKKQFNKFKKEQT